MVLSTREKYIAYGVGGAVVLLALNFFAINPYLDYRIKLADDIRNLVKQQNENNTTFHEHGQLQKVWHEMIAGGLKDNSAAADKQLVDALFEWAQESGIQRPSYNFEKSSADPDRGFEQTTYRMTGNGNMAAVAKLLWRLETAPIPLHVTDVAIQGRPPEGTDDLQVQVTVSTLSTMPMRQKEENRPKLVSAAGGASP
jgi:hypothetical protein